MKKERRHELSENVLAHELAQAKTFLQRYGNWIIGALTVLIIAGLIGWYHHRKVYEELANETYRYQALISSINSDQSSQNSKDAEHVISELEELAKSAKSPIISALAAINVADLMTGRYTYALSQGQVEKAQKYRKKAEQLYQFILSKHSDRKIFVAKANFGLGTLAENQGQWEAAISNYQKVRRSLISAYPVVSQAIFRINRIKQWSELGTNPIRFATTIPATQPGTKSSTTTPTLHDQTTTPPTTGKSLTETRN
ncbi:hypothetical protein DRZ77_03420 [Candidatus Woesearchaeota archaeon]|nr:MAG: hypothetical protein DRZ77_03420 [Candidatus Woesearchaeota archaeon]